MAALALCTLVVAVATGVMMDRRGWSTALRMKLRLLFLVVCVQFVHPQDDRDRDPLDLIESGDEPEVLEVKLIHNHLPKLEEMGYITWDRETDEISKGPNWEEIAPLLELIDTHRDELPDGWL
jgi:hypothetical protein